MRKLALLELLIRRYPQKSRKELNALILRGNVLVDGQPVLKPGIKAAEDAAVSLRESRRFVSRGGEKLSFALDAFGVSPRGKVVLDAGSSTGGFTDCLLQNGAARVYSVDVGYNVIDYALRCDPRVVVMERTNVMTLTRAVFTPQPHIAVADLSFRSLRKAARHILGITREGTGIFLAKPQFEWEEPPPEFTGVVRGEGNLREIMTELLASLEEEGVHPLAGVPSPIAGRKGNREFLLLLGTRPAEGGGAGSLVDLLLRE